MQAVFPSDVTVSVILKLGSKKKLEVRKVQRAIAGCQKIGKEEPSVTDIKENPKLGK